LRCFFAWINFAVLTASALPFCFFYTKSVRPAALEKEIGEAYEAYRQGTGFFFPKLREIR
jgi:hypothetical protein